VEKSFLSGRHFPRTWLSFLSAIVVRSVDLGIAFGQIDESILTGQIRQIPLDCRLNSLGQATVMG
jgi:hypothetical protein